jgi:cobalt-zinc-cadmium efflux system outer membrane protein
MLHSLRCLVAASLSLALAACVSLPHESAREVVAREVDARLAPSRATVDDAWIAATLAEPLTRHDAVRIALARNPRVAAELAELGFARADLIEAGRLSNPRLELSFLDIAAQPGSSITRSIALSFAELLTLTTRVRLAEAEHERTRLAVAAAALELAHEVERAWYTALAARQVEAMQGVIAEAAEASAELAERFHAAGNLPERELMLERAAASEARLRRERAAGEAFAALGELALLLGDPGSQLMLPRSLPAPLAEDEPLEELIALQTQRLDLAAARKKVEIAAAALATARRWRLVGEIDLGYEREREPEESKRGPVIELALPIFQQGQAGIARAEAELERARAELAIAEAKAIAALRLAHAEAQRHRRQAAEYRRVLVPAREAIVARTQEEVNFMLEGTFQLLEAKREEYAAYAEFLEAVRDYWLARSDLRHAAGAVLPHDQHAGEPELGPDVMLPGAEATEPNHHHAHDHGDLP